MDKQESQNTGSDQEPVDLFEHLETLPEQVQSVLAEFAADENDYKACAELEEALKPLGYTFDYYLDAVPVNLRRIDGLEEEADSEGPGF